MNRRRLAAGLPGQVVPEKPDAGVAADLKEFGVAGEWPNVQLSELSDFLTGFPFRFPWTDSLMGSLNCLIARLGKETISDRLYLLVVIRKTTSASCLHSLSASGFE